jgi:hypothetical protein
MAMPTSKQSTNDKQVGKLTITSCILSYPVASRLPCFFFSSFFSCWQVGVGFKYVRFFDYWIQLFPKLSFSKKPIIHTSWNAIMFSERSKFKEKNWMIMWKDSSLEYILTRLVIVFLKLVKAHVS